MSKQGTWLPGQTIGILGGGQLGRMLILEGRKMGYRFVTLDPSEDCPGSQVADDHIVGAYDDLHAAQKLAEQADVIVYEFENIDPQVVQYLERIKPVPQGSQLLSITHNRLYEKKALERAGVPVAPYRIVQTIEDLNQAVKKLGIPGVLKSTTGGYDGKGQWMIRTLKDVEQLPADMFSEERLYIFEQFVPFIKEVSVVVARSTMGEVQAFPAVVNLHRHHILHMTIAPGPLEKEVAQAAEELAIRVAEQLQVVGLIAVEMFLLPDGKLWVNELAPRPHNSGHYTLDACVSSQFEQFLRAVLGLPLQSPKLVTPAVMINLLGEHCPAFMTKMAQLPPQVKVHWYGKKDAKRGRKMGHVTILVDRMEEALTLADQLGIWPPLTEDEKQAIIAKCKPLEGVEAGK
ncbi:5-(carboxyamino)imidazole ribonucleotide synthase [Thermoflavimicrobium dichotomicum]|uniref:N5-carboxyaminoimidazole ribonucleotide synthase n=1 Tax=Thermoflavimicrobium dichotomicum TaxID=46223 RepID=A0A1I3RI41_9BACL|nr:5-(carboxyamino)imidazole ribonucleotide synthase [Thermoflavimicrobium dichotomicum]SFJ45379.1 5-(carboxyamino)imidazole ribonucleotide synthase [Thermoflavimicrobium dichotomicum]